MNKETYNHDVYLGLVTSAAGKTRHKAIKTIMLRNGGISYEEALRIQAKAIARESDE